MSPPAASALVLAPVRSLGLVLAGCPDCRVVLGIDGAPGLADALATHAATCPAADPVCPGCGCEAQLYPDGTGWRCGDCLGERLFDELALGGLAVPARPWPRAVSDRQQDGQRHPGAGAEPPVEAVA